MRNRGFLLGALLIGVVFAGVALHVDARSGDETAIRALNLRFSAAVKAKDSNKIMTAYVPDESLFVFDAIPPRQYVPCRWPLFRVIK